MNHSTTIPIADRLRWAREQAGLTQGQVAKLLGVHRPTISNIESGDRSLKAEEVTFFADAYEVSPEWILNGDDAIDDDATVRMVARELSKLSEDDLGVVLRAVRTLRRQSK